MLSVQHAGSEHPAYGVVVAVLGALAEEYGGDEVQRDPAHNRHAEDAQDDPESGNLRLFFHTEDCAGLQIRICSKLNFELI